MSESSVKRWADQGELALRRTPGGHRKLAVADVLRFVRAHGYSIEKPELLGLPAQRAGSVRADVLRSEVLAAMLAGDGRSVARILVHSFAGGATLCDLFDTVLAPAMHDVGLHWERGDALVYQEHRATGLVHRALYELRQLLPEAGKRARTAVCAAPRGDPYTVALTMVELVLVERGWRVHNLGADNPAEVVREALERERPRMLCLSLTSPTNPEEFAREWAPVSEQIRDGKGVLVVGGGAVDSELRSQLRATAYCQSTRELADLVSSLR